MEAIKDALDQQFEYLNYPLAQACEGLSGHCFKR